MWFIGMFLIKNLFYSRLTRSGMDVS
jgi:hypothetical protein